MAVDHDHLAKNPRPRGGLGVREYLFYRTNWLSLTAPHKLFFRLEGRGVEQIPRDGGVLVLANHVSALDPFWVGWLPVRPLRFMASEAVIRTPVLGPWISRLGAFPKMKYVKDRASMETLQRHYDAGHGILLFPEGRRSWDTSTQEVLPGIGRLVKRMGARVVCARNLTGALVQPRWAKVPRFVPVIVEYDAPVTYPDDWTAEQITADIQRRLHVEAEVPEGRLTAGLRMAHGLPQYLWGCPRCFALETLRPQGVRGNRVACTACDAHWRIDTSTRLHPVGAERARAGEILTVGAAAERVRRHYGDPPAVDRARFVAEGVAITAPAASIRRLPRKGKPSEVAAGELVLKGDALEVRGEDGAPAWRLDHDEVLAVSVEIGNQLQLRTAEALYAVDVPGESPLKWSHFFAGHIGGIAG